MRILLLILVLLAATAGVLFLPGLLGGDAPDATPEGGARPEPSSTPELAGPGETELRGSEPPTEQPDPQRLRLERPLKVLLLASNATSWNVFQVGALRSDEKIRLVSYAQQPSLGGENPLGEGPPPGSPPDAAWFDAQGFDVVIVSQIDPDALDPALWDAVAGRVRAGTLGLWVQPGLPLARPGSSEAPTSHPLLEQPALASVLPVASALPLAGPSLPGVFANEAPFALTAAGEKHVASRIVYWPEWARRIWQLGASSPKPWGSKFCYPVERLREGALVLVEARPPSGPPIPMYVQGAPGSGRVLWFGAQDFGHHTYRDVRAAAQWEAMFRNAVIWLAGRAPPEEYP